MPQKCLFLGYKTKKSSTPPAAAMFGVREGGGGSSSKCTIYTPDLPFPFPGYIHRSLLINCLMSIHFNSNVLQLQVLFVMWARRRTEITCSNLHRRSLAAQIFQVGTVVYTIVLGGPNITKNLYCICLSKHETCS